MMETQSEIKTQNCEREAISRARIEQLKYNGKVLQKGETKRKADKGAWGMPRLLTAMKDVTSCEKPRLGANARQTRGCPNGETRRERSRHRASRRGANAGN